MQGHCAHPSAPQAPPPLALHLLLQLIEEAPVGPLGDDLLWARLDHPRLLQAQGERPVFQFGDLSVDLVRRIVKLSDKEVKLSPKEYDLLRLLVQHAGKVLTHKFLMQELWDEPTDPQYLRVYVRQLRQKIEPDPERPQHIMTEIGIGYRLRAPD